jgi:pimeloyl-ACP methyl ester carboxylesterase
VRVIARLLTGAALLAFAGTAYQAIASVFDRRRFPPPGRLVDVGGHRLHITSAGEGGPAVIVTAAGAGAPTDWHAVLPEVARFTQICTFDRPGSGWSDSGPLPRTSERIAEELHELLERARIAGSCVLVGHSIAGIHLRMFAARHPERVAGLVLVDSSHPEQLERLPEENRRELKAYARVLGLARLLAPFGLVRLAAHLGLIRALDMYDVLQPALRAQARAITFWSDMGMLQSELGSVPDSLRQVRSASTTLGDTPLFVLTAGAEDNRLFQLEGAREAWMEMQRELAALSTNSKHIIAERSSHYIHVDQPELVVDAIRWVVEQARSG